jgi:hypothetical protein
MSIEGQLRCSARLATKEGLRLSPSITTPSAGSRRSTFSNGGTGPARHLGDPLGERRRIVVLGDAVLRDVAAEVGQREVGRRAPLDPAGPPRPSGAPPVQYLARSCEVTPVDEIGERMSGSFRSSSSKSCKTSKHGLGLNEVNVCQRPAVAPVPAECCPLEAGRLRVEEKKDELQGIRQPDLLEVCRRRQGDPRVAGVERAAEAAVGGTFGGHEQMFARATAI